MSQINSDMATTIGETRRNDSWAELVPTETIALVSSPRPSDDASVVVRTPTAFQDSSTSPVSNQQAPAVQNTLRTQQSSPLSAPPKSLPTTPNNAGSGGGGVGGRSTPNAGMGGGGPTGGGGGPGLVNANQFVGVNFGASGSNASVAGEAVAPRLPSDSRSESATPANSPSTSSPLTAFQTMYSMTPPTQTQPLSPMMTLSMNHSHGHDPLYVLDMNTGETVPANVTLNTFSSWSENLLAQVSGATVSSYSWNVSQAPDLTSVSGTNTANL